MPFQEKGWLLLCMVASLLASAALPVMAGEDARLKQCKKLQADIDRYEALRRDGGNAQKMDAWKRARREAQSRFRELGCHYRYNQLD